ncbi:MAG: hypothetical protein JST39_21050 [Bacteroidetes bacterium]|nr:hypothetical protein [Bacteroidota bacterium]
MKNILILLMAAFVMASPACKKHSNDNGTSSEAKLAVQTTPSTGTTDPAAPGPNFTLIVNVTSAMPSGGIKIQVTAKKDGSSDAPFFNYSQNSSSANNTITITGTPSSTVCLVNITVTSLSDGTNGWNGSYRYSMK